MLPLGRWRPDARDTRCLWWPSGYVRQFVARAGAIGHSENANATGNAMRDDGELCVREPAACLNQSWRLGEITLQP